MLCLTWNDYLGNIISSYQELRKIPDFSDVTLVCEDGQMIEAHRIILAASSPFFSEELKRSKDPHPIINMGETKAKDLSAIMDYIYHGNTKIFQEDLAEFLILANYLQLKGSKCEVFQKKEEPDQDIEDTLPGVSNIETHNLDSKTLNVNPSDPAKNVAKQKLVAYSSIETHKINSLMKTFYAKVKILKCTVCGKENRGKFARSNMNQHISQKHPEGILYELSQCEDNKERIMKCTVCGKLSRGKFAQSNMNQHISQKHPEEEEEIGEVVDKRGKDMEGKTNLMIETLYEKELKVKCTMCEKEYNGIFARKTLRQHLVNNHIEGVLYTCHHCGENILSRSALKQHISTEHKFKSLKIRQKDIQGKISP